MIKYVIKNYSFKPSYIYSHAAALIYTDEIDKAKRFTKVEAGLFCKRWHYPVSLIEEYREPLVENEDYQIY